MAKKQQQSNPPQDSRRWPRLFANQERAQSLLDNPDFHLLLQDLEDLRQALVFDVIHKTPTMETTNFFRGQIAILERFVTLPDELADWKRR